MPSLMRLKTATQTCLRPVCEWLHARGVTPNLLTGLTMAGAVMVGAVLWRYARWPAVWWLAPAWGVLRLLLNVLDGQLAREHGLRTRLGAVLNEVSDGVCDAAYMLPLAAAPGVQPALVVLLVVSAQWAEVAGLGALVLGGPRRYDGPLAKPDRTAACAVLAGVLGSGVPAGTWTSAVLVLLIALSLWTLVTRVRRAAAPAQERV